MTEEVREKIGAAVRAELHPNWGGGQWANVSLDGRVFVRVPNEERHLHPTIRKDGYIRRYHYVWNKAHPDDPVRGGEVIHHRNEDPTDDRLENLEKTVQSAHAREHGTGHKHRPESLDRMARRQSARRIEERRHRRPEWLTEACGTTRGYFRHRSAGGPACPACLAAHAEQAQQSRERRHNGMEDGTGGLASPTRANHGQA